MGSVDLTIKTTVGEFSAKMKPISGMVLFRHLECHIESLDVWLYKAYGLTLIGVDGDEPYFYSKIRKFIMYKLLNK